MVLVTLSFDGYRIFYVITPLFDAIVGINSNLYPVNSEVAQGSVISSTICLLFLNDPLCLTTNSIYSFADDRCFYHSYSYNAHHNLNEVGVSRNCMDDTLYSDLVKLSSGGVQIEWNLTHAKPNAVCYAQANLRSWPKRLYGWYVDCEIGDS